MASKEEILAKARAKLQQMKSATADDPVLVPKTNPPQLRTPEINYQDTKGNPMGVLSTGTEAKFWCAHANHIVHARNGVKLQFTGNTLVLTITTEIAYMREMTKLFPSKFKEM